MFLDSLPTSVMASADLFFDFLGTFARIRPQCWHASPRVLGGGRGAEGWDLPGGPNWRCVAHRWPGLPPKRWNPPRALGVTREKGFVVFHARFLYSTKVFPPCFCAYPGRSLPLHHRGVSSGPHHGTSYRFANGRGCHKPARALALGLAPGGATCTLVYDTHANSEAASGGRRSAARSSFLRAPSGSTPMSSRSWFVSKHSAARSTSARTKSLRAHPRERCG
jgi:hypothetical protein